MRHRARELMVGGNARPRSTPCAAICRRSGSSPRRGFRTLMPSSGWPATASTTTARSWFPTAPRPPPACPTDRRETLPVDAIGEICARGVGVMTAYFDDEPATAAVIDKDGWLHTGDLGSIDATGYCRIQGRLKDMIIRGGENIYPREIEDILYMHPGVAGVAVTGVQDAEWGEKVAAFVQQRRGHSLSRG